MSNGWAIGCKIVAWIALIGGSVASIIVAITLERWWPFLALLPGALVTFLLFGTLSYIAEKVY